MIIAGTMEAFTDFQKPSSDKTSITTYLEGEIIDFKTHSLETFNFPSNIKDDAHNWRKLEPFCQLSNEQLVKSLVSRKFMKGLADNWVFMRWKGKILCPFQVTPIIVLIYASRFLFHYLPAPFQLGQLFFPHPPPQLRLCFRKYWTIIKEYYFAELTLPGCFRFVQKNASSHHRPRLMSEYSPLEDSISFHFEDQMDKCKASTTIR